MTATKKEELIRILHKGYNAALDNCTDNRTFYAQGFLDGMKFQKDRTIPKSDFDKMLEKFENK